LAETSNMVKDLQLLLPVQFHYQMWSSPVHSELRGRMAVATASYSWSTVKASLYPVVLWTADHTPYNTPFIFPVLHGYQIKLLAIGIDVCTHHSYDASCRWRPRLLCGSREDLLQAPAQDITFYPKLSQQLPLHTTNCFRPVPRIPSFCLTLLGVLAAVLTLRHLNQFFDEWINEWIYNSMNNFPNITMQPYF